MTKLSVLIPAYNEERIIKDNLESIKKTLNSFKINYEIILINDGSKDNTLKEAKKVKNIKIINYKNNKGKGNALKYGFQFSKGDLICFLDADLELSPALIKEFIELMNKNNADVIIGNKRHSKSIKKFPLKRRILSYGYSLLVKLLFMMNINDTQTGIKLFKRKVLESVFKKSSIKGFSFDLELFVNIHKLKYKILESPVIITFRRGKGETRIGFRALFSMLKDTLTIFYKYYFTNCYN